MLTFIHGKRKGEEMKAIDDGEHTPEITKDLETTTINALAHKQIEIANNKILSTLK